MVGAAFLTNVYFMGCAPVCPNAKERRNEDNDPSDCSDNTFDVIHLAPPSFPMSDDALYEGKEDEPNMTTKHKPKLTDAERHARFVAMAREVGASEDAKDFDKAFGRVTTKSPIRKL